MLLRMRFHRPLILVRSGMPHLFAAAFCVSFLIAAISAGHAQECPASSDALGVSRIISIDPTEHPRIGSAQYAESLPLQDHELVLTFDDGPIEPYTGKVLDALAAECLKATFFVVGKMAKEFPELVRRAYREGHTIGTHTENHAHLDLIRPEAARKEIREGIASVSKVLGSGGAAAPFFRFPYLDETRLAEDFALKQGLMVWSADSFISDWTMATPQKIIEAVTTAIERKKKGIVLLHDIQEKTALALPSLLSELKKRRYHIVHIVPADATHPKTETKAEQWAAID